MRACRVTGRVTPRRVRLPDTVAPSPLDTTRVLAKCIFGWAFASSTVGPRSACAAKGKLARAPDTSSVTSMVEFAALSKSSVRSALARGKVPVIFSRPKSVSKATVEASVCSK